MITRVTRGEKLQIKCHMYYNVSLVQPGDREEKGKFRGNKKEEKDGRQQSRRDKIQILSWFFCIIRSAVYKSVELLDKCWKLWVPQLEY